MTSLPLVFAAPRRGKPPRHLADLDAEGRRAAVAELGLPAFRADQLSRHYFGRLESDAATMTDLPATLRDRLGSALLPPLLTVVRELETDAGTTRKTLWRLHDGALVESVLMRYPDRVTVCVSSQAGCGMACPFCATGQGGLTRNLSAAEIVEQVVAGARVARSGTLGGTPARLSNVVFMGMGEPLANYPRLAAALHRLVEPAPGGLGLSQRSITVSTVGLVPAIGKLAEENLNLTLAVSLHAPDDELRGRLMPVTKRFPIAELMEACARYRAATRRRVFVEYLLLEGVNDSRAHARALADLLRPHGRGAFHVNLIAYNPTAAGYKGSAQYVVEQFSAELERGNVGSSYRQSRGREIDAACGQLAMAGVPARRRSTATV
jgi:23S rRNA (adenine2503-C2)-methyltransferase